MGGRRNLKRKVVARRTIKRKAKPVSAEIIRIPPKPEPSWLLTQDEVTLIKNSIAKGATDEELKFCLTVARRYRLDPFKQQIWFVKRWDKSADNGQGGKGTFVWTPQVGIHGLLFTAARDHKMEFGSVSLPEFGPIVDKHPQWARVKVWKKGSDQPTEAEAWWDEYAPADMSKAPFWIKMPRRMIGKCATALAIRQAYPDLGGLHIPEECERMSEDRTQEGRQIIEQEKPAGSLKAAQDVANGKIREAVSKVANPNAAIFYTWNDAEQKGYVQGDLELMKLNRELLLFAGKWDKKENSVVVDADGLNTLQFEFENRGVKFQPLKAK